jgi:flagellar basal-body rod protein FlgC
MSLLNIFEISGSAMTAQSVRLNTIASNLANADSTASAPENTYKAKHVVFEAHPIGESKSTGVKIQKIIEDTSAPRMMHNPAHPNANSEGFVSLPNVNITQQMVDMISTSRAYQNNVETMNAAKSMLLKTLTLGQE